MKQELKRSAQSLAFVPKEKSGEMKKTVGLSSPEHQCRSSASRNTALNADAWSEYTPVRAIPGKPARPAASTATLSKKLHRGQLESLSAIRRSHM
jgi:hypothetical protein